MKKNSKSFNYIYDQFNTDILVMTDSVAIKVPENQEVALNQESELRQQMPN